MQSERRMIILSTNVRANGLKRIMDLDAANSIDSTGNFLVDSVANGPQRLPTTVLTDYLDAMAPERGVDYWTTADQEAIILSILESTFPNAEEVEW